MTSPAAYQKPVPVRTEENAPYWDSAKAHALKMQRCRACELMRYPCARFCPRCLSEAAEWQELSGHGTLYSFIVVHQRYDPSFAEDLPYNVAIIELEEGPRLVSNVVDCANAELRIGMPVQLTYDDVTEEFTLPKFRPAV